MSLKHTLLKPSILFLLVVLVVGIVLYLSRQIFYYKYDPTYQEDLYYHSQWNIPDSVRGISDGELYKFVGYKLVEGENPFNINYEIPPFAKYLYGLGSYHLGNPYLVSVGLYIGSIIVIYLLLKELFENRHLILLGTLLFASTPFIATQVPDIMLDLPLTFFFLVHALFFIRYLKEQKLINLLAAGVFIGLASGSKLGIYAPFAIVAAEIVLFYLRKYKAMLIYPGTVIGGYLASYFMYFLKHPNPFPWLRLHEKTVNFYMGGGNPVTILNQWKLIFLNQYEGWWDPGNISSIRDWSLLLPSGVVALVYVLYKAFKRKKLLWMYIGGLTLSFLLVNSLIPFYPRYLMPAIPFFVLLIVKLFRKYPHIILVFALLNIPVLFSSLYSNDPTGDVHTTAKFISTRAYKELYKMSLPESLGSVSMDEFIQTNEGFYEAIGTRQIEVVPKDWKLQDNKVVANYTVSYHTHYGVVTHSPQIIFERLHNRWQLVWDWDYLWGGYSPDSTVVIKEGTNLQNEHRLVYIIPRVMNPWNEFLDKLLAVTIEDRSTIDKSIRNVVPDHFPRFVGYMRPELTDLQGEEMVNKIPGATIKRVNESANTEAYIQTLDGQKIPIEFRVENETE